MNSRLAELFLAFAGAECRETSPLYFHLSQAIATDAAMLQIAGQTQPGQPVPNLFLAAVHYLLVADPTQRLAQYYATCTPNPKRPTEAFPAFQDFVFAHQDEIVSLLKTRLVQTNEVRRCACLYPAFLFALQHFEAKPLALVEIGCSAGLNLLWDRYRYAYNESGEDYGDKASPVLITSEFLTHRPDVLADPLPVVSHRIGVDLNVIDVKHPDQVNWLKSLIWPELHERRALMDAALQRQADVNLDLRTGNGFALIEALADEIPESSLVCFYHTHVANQLSGAEREQVLERVARVGSRRDLIHLFNNLQDARLQIQVYRDGSCREIPVAKTDGHGRWLEWLAGNA